VRRTIGDDLDEFRPHAAIVEKSVARGGGAVATNDLPLIVRPDQEFERAALDLDNPLRKAGVSHHIEQLRRALSGDNPSNARPLTV